MDEYLVSYEYKEDTGYYISVRTKTAILMKSDIGELAMKHNDYLKILFCQKL